MHRVINLPGQINKNTFYFVKIRRFPNRNKHQVCTKKVFNTDSPIFNESFNLINARNNPLSQLEVRIFRGKVCSIFKTFKISRQVTRIVVDLTQISECNVTKYFNLEDIPKAM